MVGSEKCFIMLCTNSTENECLGRGLFGDRRLRLEYVKDIQVGDIGFLLNTTRNKLIGPFRALSEAQLDIQEDAWQGEFRAQVQVEAIGKPKQVSEAATILATAGVELDSLPHGALVPMLPVQNPEVTKKLMTHFAVNK